jgi:hypothetical protein
LGDDLRGLAVRQHPALAGNRFERGPLACLGLPDRSIGRVLGQQAAVAVEQGDAIGAGEAAQERRGGLGGFGVEAAAKRAGGERGGVQCGVHRTFGRGGHDATGAHRDDRCGHRRQDQRGCQRYREFARHLTSPRTLD